MKAFQRRIQGRAHKLPQSKLPLRGQAPAQQQRPLAWPPQLPTHRRRLPQPVPTRRCHWAMRGDCDSHSDCAHVESSITYNHGMYCNSDVSSGARKFPSMDEPALAHCSGAGKLAAGWDYCTYPPGSTGPTNATADLVSELSLLLTAGRLPEGSKQMIVDAYDERLDETRSTSEALKWPNI